MSASPFSSPTSSLEQQFILLEQAIRSPSENPITPLISKILKIIAAHGTLWKTFKRWGKVQEIKKEYLDRSNVETTAIATQEIWLNTMAVDELKKLIIEAERRQLGTLSKEALSSDNVPTSPKNSLRVLDDTFLQEATRKGQKKVVKTIETLKGYAVVESQLPSLQQELLKRLQDNIKVWLLRYLARGAKIPILDQKGPIHISPVEYHTSNLSEYYRHDGGATLTLLLNCVRKKYSFPKHDDYHFEVIKPSLFSSICQVVCHHTGNEYHVAKESVESICEDLKDLAPGSFLDVSFCLQNTFDGRGNMNLLMDHLSQSANASQKSIIFGGIIEINKTIYYILFSNREVGEFAKQLKELRGGVGAIPGMAHIERQLIKEGFPLDKLFSLFPTPSVEETPPITIKGDLTGAIAALEQVEKRFFPAKDLQTQVAQVYLELFEGQLKTMKELLVGSFCCDLKELGPLTRSIETFGKHLLNLYQIDQIEGMTHSRKFQEILQEVYLLEEELSFMLCFVMPSAESNAINLAAIVQDLTPVSPYKRTYSSTSGMSGYWHVFESLKRTYTSRPHIAFLDTTYYEIVSEQNLGAYLEQFASSSSQVIEKLLTPDKPYDAICMDIYPNYVPINPVKTPPIIEIVNAHLQERSAEYPLTVILDATGGFFWDAQIEALLKEFEATIDQGALNIVVITSLAKFGMGGMDKYTGGVVQTYNHFPGISMFQEFNRQIAKATTSDPPTIEAQKFFSVFMKDEGKWLKGYLRGILENIERMYHLLAPLQAEESPVRLCGKDKGIPILGFSFKAMLTKLFGRPQTFAQFVENEKCSRNLAHFMQHFLAAKALACDLPTSIRMSFGFPSMNFTVCDTALRFTVGLEDTRTVEEYASLLREENEKIERQLELIGANKELLEKIDYLLDLEHRYLGSWLEQHKLQLINYAKNHTFLEAMVFIYDHMNPYRMLLEVRNSLPSPEAQERVNRSTKDIVYCIQNHLFTQERLPPFINDKFIPLEGVIHTICDSSKNQLFIELVKTNLRDWLEFLTEHPLDALKNYTVNFFWVTRFHIYVETVFLNKSNSNALIWFERFKDETLNFAKSHSLESLREFTEFSCAQTCSKQGEFFNFLEGEHIKITLPFLPGLPP